MLAVKSDCLPSFLPFIHLCLVVLFDVLPSFRSEIEHAQSVSNHIFLDLVVKRRVSRERWRTVDLEKVWLELFVN